MTLIVKVTQQHIAAGKMRSTTACPIVHALRDAGIRQPRVSSTVWWLQSEGYAYSLTERAKRFIRRFDSGKSVKPVTLRLSMTQRMTK